MELVTDLLARARAAGLTVRADGGRLIVRGPRRAEALARQIGERKPEILQALGGAPEYGGPWRETASGRIVPARLPAAWREWYEERAAIREFDGGQPREHAEAEALAETLAAMQAAGEWPRAENPDDRREKESP